MKARRTATRFLITNDNAASAPHILKLTYDYTKVLVPVIHIAHQPQIFAVHPSLGVNSVKEYVANAKKNPGRRLCTHPASARTSMWSALWFAREAGIKMEHVPYRGAGQAVTDLLAGHVKSAFLGPTSLIAHCKAGTLKIHRADLGQARADAAGSADARRSRVYKGVVLEAWYAAFAPSGTPPEIVKQINAAIQNSLSDPKLLENFTKGSLEPVGGTPEALGKLARADSVKYERLVKELNITAGG